MTTDTNDTDGASMRLIIREDIGLTTRRRFVLSNVAWLLVILLVQLASDRFALDTFFILGFAGYLVIREVSTYPTVMPVWRRWLRWPTIVGYLLFGYFMLVHIQRILPGLI